MTVLIADSDNAYRAFLRSVLEFETALKVVAETPRGEEAIRLSQQFKPDLVLMNTGWPRTGGLQIVRRLKAEPHGPKVIALSVFDGQACRESVQTHGADGFLPKHAPLSQIISVIGGATSLIDVERNRPHAGDGELRLAVAHA